MPAANPGQILDDLPDTLVEVEADGVGIADARAAEIRHTRHGDRSAVGRRVGQRPELVPARVLNAQLAQFVAADGRDELRRRRIHAVSEVGRAVGRRQAAGNVRQREVLEQEVPGRQPVRGVDLIVGLAKQEVDLLMRRDDAVRRYGQAQRLHRRWRDGDDLVARDQAAVHVLIRAVVVPLVLDDRPAERQGDVVDFGVGLPGSRREKEWARRHVVPAEAEACRSVEAVGSRRGNRVVDHPGRLAEFRRKPVGDHLDLAHEHLRHGQQAQPGAILLGVRVAVDLIVGPHLRAVGVDAGHAELVVLVAGHVGLKESEIVGIARDERQVLDLVLVDRPPEVNLARLGNRRLARHRHRLGDAPDAELHVDECRLARRKGDALLLESLEPLQLGDDAVPSEGQEDGAIDSLVVGNGRPGRPGVHVRHCDRDAGQRGTGRITDDAFDVAVCGLRLGSRGRGRRESHQNAQDRRRQNSKHAPLPLLPRP